MNKQLIRMVPVVAAVALFQGGIERKGSFDITEATFAPNTKVLVTEALERKGSFDLTKKGSFDTQGKDPEVPVSPNFAGGEVVVNGKDPEVPVDPKLLSTPVEKKGSFDITEQAPEFPNTPSAYKRGSFDITERIMAGSGTSKGGDVPVTPGLSKRGVGGTDKGGEVPVTPGLNKPSASGTDKGGSVPVTPN